LNFFAFLRFFLFCLLFYFFTFDLQNKKDTRHGRHSHIVKK